MTRIHPDDVVVYEVALCDHPVTISEEDSQHEMVSDDMLIAEAEGMLSVEDMDFPDFHVFRSDPPDAPLVRYVNTTERINVRMVYEEYDPFEEIVKRVDFDGWDYWPDDVAMSCPPPTHSDDFDGTIHLDLASEGR